MNIVPECFFKIARHYAHASLLLATRKSIHAIESSGRIGI